MKKILTIFSKLTLSALVVFLCLIVWFISYLMIASGGRLVTLDSVIAILIAVIVAFLFLPLIWLRKLKSFKAIWLSSVLLSAAALGITCGIKQYNESLIINTSPNIQVEEYLPFDENSKIVKLENSSLRLTENLPRIDGAAALFPVYSAFVNAVYPESTRLGDEFFQYNNTPKGYRYLAERHTDIFIGVYPSDEQKAEAEKYGTTFKYTPIGSEAFVFFVHKDNPVESLSAEQIRDIYSGKITNWSEVGGSDEEIAAFQRNEGSGSQSMLKRFMGDKPLAKPPVELVNDLMAGIIEKVSDYKSSKGSIGFSFRFYVEGIIKNPNIKMLAIDGIAPTAENIRNGSYPVVTPIYAVTYEENTNENVDKLLRWILSDEGQSIIEKTGYVGN